MKTRLLVAGAVAVLIAGGARAGTPAAAAWFDKPLAARQARLSADPVNPKAKRQARCFDYPRFTIKQIDLGEVGADRLAILPGAASRNLPCRQQVEPGEYIIAPETWSGYFAGIKADYAFFNAADGVNGGLGFMVFGIGARKKLFEDAAQTGLLGLELRGRTLELRYLRVFTAKCSVVRAGAPCRDAIAAQTGLAQASLGLCAAGYQAAKHEMASARCAAAVQKDTHCAARELQRLDAESWDDAPTVIAYPVAAMLDGETAQVKPAGEIQACRPAD